MAFTSLSYQEQVAVKEAITAVLVSPHIGASELETIHGVPFERMKAVLRQWPNLDDQDRDTANVINGCLYDVAYSNFFSDEDARIGIGLSDAEWARWFSVSREDIRRTFDRWDKLKSGDQ